jgi:hypothetical protein
LSRSASDLATQARRHRRLAAQCDDDRTQQTLMLLAQDYERRAKDAEPDEPMMIWPPQPRS